MENVERSYYLVAQKNPKGEDAKVDAFIKAGSLVSDGIIADPNTPYYLTVTGVGGGYSVAVYNDCRKRISDLVGRVRPYPEEQDVEGNTGNTYKILPITSELEEMVKTGYTCKVVAGFGNGVILEVKEAKAKVEAKANKAVISGRKAEIIAEIGEESFNKRVQYLFRIGIKEKDINFQNFLELFHIGKELGNEPKILYEPDGKNNIVRDVLTKYFAKANPKLVGPKAVGKNVALETICWLLNLKMVTLQCGPSLDKDMMYGSVGTDNSSNDEITPLGASALLNAFIGGGVTDQAVSFLTAFSHGMSPKLIFKPGPVVQALEEAEAGNGVMLVVDEMNTAPPAVLVEVFNTLGDDHTAYVDVPGYRRVPICRENFFMAATQNNGYIGTQEQNSALKSRFVTCYAGQPTSIRNILVQEGYEVSDELLDTFDALYKEFNVAVQSGTVSEECLNIRGFKAAVRLIAKCNEKSRKAVMDCVCRTSDDEDEWVTLEELLKIHLRDV